MPTVWLNTGLLPIQLRADVYSMDLPAFKVRDIPKSIVTSRPYTRAIYENFDAKKKTGVGVRPGPMMLYDIPAGAYRGRASYPHADTYQRQGRVGEVFEFEFRIDNKKIISEGW